MYGKIELHPYCKQQTKYLYISKQQTVQLSFTFFGQVIVDRFISNHVFLYLGDLRGSDIKLQYLLKSISSLLSLYSVKNNPESAQHQKQNISHQPCHQILLSKFTARNVKMHIGRRFFRPIPLKSIH